MTDSLSSTFTGRVVAVNERGLRLDGHDDWFNVSKFAVGVVLPERGAVVTVSVDTKGFLRACLPADGAGPAPAPLPVAGGSSAGATASHDRDRTITRLAVLKSAAAFAATRPTASSADVLKVAAVWERWVLRADDPDAGVDDDLVDAF